MVADTSPINYLILIGKLELVKYLYLRIPVPPAVLAERRHPLAPGPVRDWALNTPSWVEMLSPKSNVILAALDPGESEALSLAAEVHADVVLMDEQAGRQEAIRRGLKVAGTLSVLDDAEQAGLVNFDDAVAEPQKTNFRVSLSVVAEIKARRSR